MDKVRRDKRKEVHTRLDFAESSEKGRRAREGSQNSSAGVSPVRYHTPSRRPRVQDRLRYNDGNVFNRLSHRRRSVHERLSDTYSPSMTRSRPSRTSSKDPSHIRGRSPSRDRSRHRDRLRDIGVFSLESRQLSQSNPSLPWPLQISAIDGDHRVGDAKLAKLIKVEGRWEMVRGRLGSVLGVVVWPRNHGMPGVGFGGKGVEVMGFVCTMAEIGCNWAKIGPSKSSQSLSNAHKWAVVID
ncbi:hypothetical protein Tco_0390310 [Tanacetum coccineum]